MGALAGLMAGAAVKAFDEVRKSGIKQVSIETTYRASGK